MEIKRKVLRLAYKAKNGKEKDVVRTLTFNVKKEAQDADLKTLGDAIATLLNVQINEVIVEIKENL